MNIACLSSIVLFLSDVTFTSHTRVHTVYDKLKNKDVKNSNMASSQYGVSRIHHLLCGFAIFNTRFKNAGRTDTIASITA